MSIRSQDSASNQIEVELFDEGVPPAFEEERPAPPPTPTTRSTTAILVLVGLALVFVAGFVFVSRPEDMTSNVAQTTRPIDPSGASTAATPLAVVNDDDVVLNPDDASFGPFDSAMPAALADTGVVSGFDRTGALVVLDWARSGPHEYQLGLVPVAAEPASQLGLIGDAMVGFGEPLAIVEASRLLIGASTAPRRVLDLGGVVPDRQGGVLVVDATAEGARTVVWQSLGGSAEDGGPSVRQWVLPTGDGAEVLGVWDGKLVLFRTGQVWLRQRDGAEFLVGPGDAAFYDGRHLVRLVCGTAGDCNLGLGLLDEPGSLIELPPSLVPASRQAWLGQSALTADGRAIAVVADTDDGPRPAIVTLDGDDFVVLDQPVSPQSPLAWSPNGQWLALATDGGVTVVKLHDGTSWSVELDRDLVTLAWR